MIYKEFLLDSDLRKFAVCVDLLTRDYLTDQKISVSTSSVTGVVSIVWTSFVILDSRYSDLCKFGCLVSDSL